MVVGHALLTRTVPDQSFDRCHAGDIAYGAPWSLDFFASNQRVPNIGIDHVLSESAGDCYPILPNASANGYLEGC